MARLLKHWRAALGVLTAVVVVGLGLGSQAGRSLAGRFIQSLRMQKVQTVSVDLSSFVGPNANRTLQQMFSQMISDKVEVTLSEDPQPAADSAEASRLAGFPVRLLGKRTDAPKLTVLGAHGFHLAVDRARLQAILTEAGRQDLSLPQSIDGATAEVQIPRTVRAQYGTCPGPRSAAANIATPPPPSSAQYSDCVILTEGRSPSVKVPPGLHVDQLAQIGLELAGMSPTQASDFLNTVDWKSTFGLSLPRSMRSYEAVEVDGVQGTLMDMVGRRGPTYTLVWAKEGVIASLTGFANSGDAVALADSLQ